MNRNLTMYQEIEEKILQKEAYHFLNQQRVVSWVGAVYQRHSFPAALGTILSIDTVNMHFGVAENRLNLG